MLRRWHRDASGLTLIEVMVAMAVMGVITSAIYMLFGSMQKSSRVAENDLQTQQLSRSSVDRMSRLLRQATLPPGRSVMLDAATDDRVVFYADIDSDPLYERIRLELKGTQLMMWTAQPDCNSASACTYDYWKQASSQVFLPGIQNLKLDAGACPGFTTNKPVFTYYERGSTGSLTKLAAPNQPDLRSSISSIGVDLVVDTGEVDGPRCRELDTIVTLRNWRGQ